MELGVLPVTPADCRMSDLDQPLLKRPRSPLAKGKVRHLSDASSSKPASSESSRSSVDLPILLGSSQGSSPGTISVSAPPSEGLVCPISKPCMAGADYHVEECVRDHEGGLGEPGGGSDLIPVEVRMLSGVLVGSVEAGLGPEAGGRGAGGGGGEEVSGCLGRGGSTGGEVSGVQVGGQGKGKEKETLVLVGIREVDVLGVEGMGGVSSVRPEGGPEAGLSAGRGLGSRGGGRGGRVLRAGAAGAGSSRDRLAVGKPRVRSRSPGGVLRREGGAVVCVGGAWEGGEGGSDGVDARFGGHVEAVDGVRGAVVTVTEGSGEGPDSAGASGSC